jgi:hypothetical protein
MGLLVTIGVQMKIVPIQIQMVSVIHLTPVEQIVRIIIPWLIAMGYAYQGIVRQMMIVQKINIAMITNVKIKLKFLLVRQFLVLASMF